MIRFFRLSFALALAAVSKTPASTDGWFATIPIEWPPRWANPQMMFGA